jgi:two-component system chemotaxis sensor kinase CheA
LAHALQTHFDEHVQGKDITFSFVVDPLLPVIDTDNQKLLKILRNLLDNAIRFTHSGTINVAFIAGEYPDFPVSCHIADTGCGIPVEKFPLIFSAFRQLNETATRQHEGLGLGLTIAKSYTQLLGGEITLSSEVGKGTEFIVKLPESPFVSKKSVIDHKVNQEEPTPLVTGMIEATAHHLPEAGSERAILLVDDDYRNQYAMKAMIEETKGNKVLIAQDGVQAMQLLKEHPEIQLVITDIAMPEMDGYDLINKIRENRVLAYLPIIAVTAMPESDEDKILSSGANAYLRKPITMDKFFHLLKHCKDANSICS